MFKIGEFSKIARVSEKLLRYYDSIGLFKPSQTNASNQYRLYSVDQLPRLNRILALRDLGFNLEQIASMLMHDLKTVEIRAMLAQRKAQLEADIAKDVERLHNVELRLQLIDRQVSNWQCDVQVKTVPEQFLLSRREVIRSHESFREAFVDARNAMTTSDANAHFTVILHSSFDVGSLDLEFGWALTNEPNSTPSTLKLRKLPGVSHMVTVLCDDWSGHALHYASLGAWIETNNHRISGPGREVFWQLHWPEAGKNILEIQFPIEHRRS